MKQTTGLYRSNTLGTEGIHVSIIDGNEVGICDESKWAVGYINIEGDVVYKPFMDLKEAIIFGMTKIKAGNIAELYVVR